MFSTNLCCRGGGEREGAPPADAAAEDAADLLPPLPHQGHDRPGNQVSGIW